jgi:hypothetical protein
MNEDLTDLIPVLWFGPKETGPDELALQLHPFPTEFDGESPASLGISVRGGETVIGLESMFDGWFNLRREQIVELHRQLGAWLEKNK